MRDYTYFFLENAFLSFLENTECYSLSLKSLYEYWASCELINLLTELPEMKQGWLIGEEDRTWH